MPHTLDAGHSADWYFIEEEVKESLKHGGFESGVKLLEMVTLATGKQIVPRKPLVVEW